MPSEQHKNAEPRNPYAPPGVPFLALGHDVLHHLIGLNDAAKNVALLWLIQWDKSTCGGRYARPVAFAWDDVKPYGICSRRTFMRVRGELDGVLFRRVKTGNGFSNTYRACAPGGNRAAAGGADAERSSDPGSIPSSDLDSTPTGARVCSQRHQGGDLHDTTHGSAGEKGVSPERGVSRGDPESGDISSLKGKDPEYSTPEVETKSLPGVAPSSRRLADTPHFIWCKYIGSEDFAGDTPKAIAARLEEIASPVLGDAVGWNFRPRVVGLLEKFGRYVFAHEAGKVLRRETPMTWISFVEAVAQACAMQNEPTRVAR